LLLFFLLQHGRMFALGTLVGVFKMSWQAWPEVGRVCLVFCPTGNVTRELDHWLNLLTIICLKCRHFIQSLETGNRSLPTQ